MWKPDIIQERALQTWHGDDITPNVRINHAVLGLAGEVGELVELWKKHLYKPGRNYSQDDFLDELGDCLYYLAILAREWECTIEGLSRANFEKLQGGHGWNGSGEKIRKRL